MSGSSPTILLTRPQAQSERFAAQLREICGACRVVISPVLEIRHRDVVPDLDGVAAVILTSENGARALAAARPVAGLQAWCVGDRTAEAAAALGMAARSAGGAAEELIAAIRAGAPDGPLLHVRGAESRGEVAGTLNAAGIETREAVLYDQRPRPLTAEARAVLAGEAPVVLPVFSPRSARFLGRQAAGAAAPLVVLALSPAVADAWGGPSAQSVHVANRPDAAAMLRLVATICGRVAP